MSGFSCSPISYSKLLFMQIIIAQAERDRSINNLLQKLAGVYRFITQDGDLGKIESMHSIVGKIIQQTLECARFIRNYTETESFCESPSYRTSNMNLILLSQGRDLGKTFFRKPLTSFNSTATLWTSSCNNFGTKLIGTWLSSSIVQVTIPTPFCLYIHFHRSRRYSGSRRFCLCKGRRTKYHETVLTRDAQGDSLPDCGLDQQQWRRY